MTYDITKNDQDENYVVSTDGIGPSSKAYESFVLPLNYADDMSTII